MKHLSIVAAVLLCTSSATVFAQQSTREDVLMKESLLSQATKALKSDIQRAPVAGRPVLARAAAAKAASASQSNSFWQTPWPYVIIGGVVAAVVIAKHHSSSSSTGGY